MLQSTKELYGYKIAASDGDVGAVNDVYFDDKRWVIRFIAADTGTWLTGRLILLSPLSLGGVDVPGKILHVALPRKQIQGSPPIEPHIPVSRQYEMDYYQHYGLPVYWPSEAISGPLLNPTGEPGSSVEVGAHVPRRPGDDKHLQSAKAVANFHIEALDGTAGHVSEFLVDDRSWSIPGLIVVSGHWYSEKEILISAENVDRICYEDSTVFVNLTREDIQKTGQTDLSRATAGRAERSHFYD